MERGSSFPCFISSFVAFLSSHSFPISIPPGGYGQCLSLLPLSVYTSRLLIRADRNHTRPMPAYISGRPCRSVSLCSCGTCSAQGCLDCLVGLGDEGLPGATQTATLKRLVHLGRAGIITAQPDQDADALVPVWFHRRMRTKKQKVVEKGTR